MILIILELLQWNHIFILATLPSNVYENKQVYFLQASKHVKRLTYVRLFTES